MPTTDRPPPRAVLRYGTTVLTATGSGDPQLLAAGMTRRLPKGGLAGPRIRPRFDLARVTTRLLDSRVLDAAVRALDLDVTRPLVDGLATFQEVRRAASRTLTEAASREETVVLREPYPVVSTHDAEIVMHVAGEKVAAFPFSLTLRTELGETSVVLRQGAVVEVAAEVCSLTASLTFADMSPPLWSEEAPKLVVHLAVRPPVPVPLVALPMPRRTTERPPVPASSRPPPR
jgi:hypothetical protein